MSPGMDRNEVIIRIEALVWYEYGLHIVVRVLQFLQFFGLFGIIRLYSSIISLDTRVYITQKQKIIFPICLSCLFVHFVRLGNYFEKRGEKGRVWEVQKKLNLMYEGRVLLNRRPKFGFCFVAIFQKRLQKQKRHNLVLLVWGLIKQTTKVFSPF